MEFWQRQFSPEEMGGLRNGMIRSTQKTFSVTTGFKGSLGAAWDYEAALSHSQYQSSIRWPQIIASKANDLFLGPQLGEDDDGFPIYNADPARLYRPLTRAEYDSISARTTYTPKSRTDTAALTLTNGELFELPGGKAGFAATAEFGNQSYALNPDPLATEYYYYSWKDSDGHGSRNRWATAAELRLPLHDTLNVSVAGRFDQYRYSGNTIGKATRAAVSSGARSIRCWCAARTAPRSVRRTCTTCMPARATMRPARTTTTRARWMGPTTARITRRT